MSNEAIPLLGMEQARTYRYTTLPTYDALVEEIQQITGRVALVTITLSFAGAGGASAADQAVCALIVASVLECLRPLVRKTDEVFVLDRQIHFLLRDANIEGAQIVQDRLWDALLWRIHNAFDGEFAHLAGVAIGHSASTEPYTTSDAFIHAASETSYRADFLPEQSPHLALPQQKMVDEQHAAEDDLLALARRLGIPYLLDLPHKLPERLKRLIDARLAQELQCYPIGRERKILTVAMLNPQDAAAVQRLQQETGLTIYPVLTHPDILQTAIQQLL